MCLIKHHEMELNGGVEVVFLTSTLDGDGGELHAPAILYLYKQPPPPSTDSTGGWVGPSR
jgi:hypothetical protein